eukprot:TRINITY_DN26273_c0_g6_i1.p1 TRINITY_DN26273_c0_g6~~TRINITY_DN26273_c0_g6_i1.p1  ORF type:complete len:396 (-),score=84.12 TRINITY_DN26273_c0_g6_i1:237-1424(-)
MAQRAPGRGDLRAKPKAGGRPEAPASAERPAAATKSFALRGAKRRIAEDGPLEPMLIPMPTLCGIEGSSVLEALHAAQRRHPIRSLWEPSLKLPPKLVEFVSAVCAEAAPEVRQDALLLLKRLFCHLRGGARAGAQIEPQVAALTCAHLSTKFWQRQWPRERESAGDVGLTEQKLHYLSKNAFTRQDFVEAEAEVLQALECVVRWPGALIAEWIGAALALSRPLLAEESSLAALGAVSAHISDLLAFEDSLMASHWPSELAAGVLHAAAMLCTRRFRRCAFLLRIGHLCRTSEELMVRLSERILGVAVGRRRTELLLEGSGLTAEATDLDEDADASAGCSSDDAKADGAQEEEDVSAARADRVASRERVRTTKKRRERPTGDSGGSGGGRRRRLF